MEEQRLPRSVVVTVAAVLVALVAFLVLLPDAERTSGADASAASRTSSTAPAAPVPGSVADLSLARMQPRSWGVAMRGVPEDLRGLESLARRTGRMPDRVMWYAAWSTARDFPTAATRRLAARGVLPEISWEPWDPGAGSTQPAYAPRRIAGGDHDRYVRRWARQVAAYGDPVVLRLAHAMNGDWYPWGAAGEGRRPEAFVAAWRHVVDLFRDAGATNVIWSWSPNVPYPGAAPLDTLYPGDAWVDRVGLDGYNWSGFRPGTSWTSFADVVEEGVEQLRALSSRPVYVAEVGSPERGGDKAAWVRQMFAYAAAHPEVRGLTWFQFRKRADWRLDSSRASLRAFRTGLADYA